MSGRIILMRHGRTFSNASGYLDTRPPGAELTDIGRGQAYDAGRRLRDIAPDVGLAVCSVALRAQQSLHLALLGYGAYATGRAGLGRSSVPTAVVTNIHEIFVGDFEGENSDEAHAAYDQVLEQWKNGSLDAALPGGETPAELLSRFVPALEEVKARAGNKDVLVVAHGAAIRIIGMHGTTLPRETVSSSYIANGSLAVIEPEGEFGTWRCDMWANTPVAR